MNPDLLATSQDAQNTERRLLSRFVEFTTLRYVAAAEWLCGIVGGNALHEIAGVNRWAAAGAVVIGVTLADYPQSRWAARRSAKGEYPVGRLHDPLTEAGALWSAAYNGAGPTVAYNEAAGIVTTSKRSKFQSLTYGLGVGLWSTPIPGFRHLADGAIEIVKEAQEKPIQYGLSGVAGSVAIFGVFEGISHFRKKREQKTENTKH
jgi:hypothetical protein